ncbi:TPA: Fic family protein [Vibrio parahaemolyticus]|uniref:Fic family protein n=1 Tax=Vibrio TaxID=662 RepID=UPI0007EE82D4|nr:MULTISPECIES: Fic/DOC family N-terminal domain-containing protein [Vibrio]HBC3583250.1 Fic family protein [Vibrio parahaemolyticus]ANN29717.1 MloA protein, putative [Vibrio vulnificus]MBS9866022.1 Fic family protein [Vibrio alginolyticus]MBS9889239.1 Fic family protein [Vibrio alginolyticus]MCA4023449.1 Fic family protein [Vibrio vulnificus]
MSTRIAPLPLANIEQWETRAVLKKAAEAHRYLAELKGVAASIPDEAILINTLSLQEAKDSSEVENIVTTHDELYKANLFEEAITNPATKEVQNYAFALKQGFHSARQSKLIRLSDILAIQQNLEYSTAGLRKLQGADLKNARTDEVVYTPPQHAEDITYLMDNLVQFINNDELCDADPLVKMAIIHHQFESIHPFYYGNGCTSRIINILYLVTKDLLNLPVLYLSRFIIHHKAEYYANLQAVRDTGNWEPWLLFMLDDIIETAQNTISLITEMKTLMSNVKYGIREQLPKLYSQDLLNNLFNHPYTKIDFIVEELGVTRITATKYLEQLVEHGFLMKQKVGRVNYYINQPLCQLLIVHS